MENSGRRSEFMNPIILKAGIPLAVSLAGFIYSLITSRRKLHTNRASEEGEASRNENESQEEFVDRDRFQDFNSMSLPSREEEEGIGFLENPHTVGSLLSLRIQYRSYLEVEILRGLMNKVRDLQVRERDLETRFLCYCSLKEHELAFTKLHNILVLEQSRVEFLRSKIESMEAENRRFELMVVEYLRVVKKLEAARLENGLLQKKSKKLLRSVRKYSNIACRQASMLVAREAEISTHLEELQGKDHLKNEIVALKRLVDRLQDEKKELGETSASSVPMKESSVDDHDQLVTELEKLRKDRAAEAEELVYLRWINACFRHELMRNQQHEEEETGEASELKEGKHQQKPKLLHKLRKWVKGSEACRRSWNGKEDKDKYHRIGSVSDRGAEQHVKMRKSCSSA